MAFPVATVLGGIGPAAEFAKNILDRIWPKKMTETEKAEDEQKRLQIQMTLETMIMERDAALTAYTKDIIAAEMAQGDAFTKRARPMVVYAGLFFIFLTEIAFPVLMWILAIAKQNIPAPPILKLPGDFWWVWGGVCSVWMVGRSFEKRGINNQIVKAITGGGMGG